MKQRYSPWAGLDQQLLRLWNVEGLSATMIAQRPEFRSFSRNAVIGRIHRLAAKANSTVKPRYGRHGIIDGKRKIRPRGPKPAPERIFRPRPISAPPIATDIPAVSPRDGGGVPLQAVDFFGCRWPVSDVPFLYCGVDARAYTNAQADWCYCAFHKKRLFARGMA